MLKAKKIPHPTGPGKAIALKGFTPREWRPFLVQHGACWNAALICYVYPGQPLPDPIQALLNTQTDLDPDAAVRVLSAHAAPNPMEDYTVARGDKIIQLDHHTELKPGDTVKPKHNKSTKLTPTRKKYLDLKAAHPDRIALLCLGDFYEAFDEDAEIVARELDLTLTHRTYKGSSDKVPMAGFPYLAADGYLKKLLERGYHLVVGDKEGTDIRLMPEPVAPVSMPDAPKRDKMAEKFRTWAEKETSFAEQREQPGELNTPRRRDQYRDNLDKAKHARIMAHKYTRLANLWESGDLWAGEFAPLGSLTTKKACEALQLDHTDSPTRTAWEELGYGDDEYNPPGLIRLREMEIAANPPHQYFPTPPSVAALMVSAANILPGDHVLEPSAGAGHLLDVLLEKESEVELDAYEVNAALCEVLSDKGYEVTRADFLTIQPVPQYDAIIMNPPFARAKEIGHQDVAHILHAYRFLKPGGTLVTLCSHASARTGEQGNQLEFRTWLNDVGAQLDDLTDGAFKDSDNPTPIAITRIRITRPEVTL